MNTQTALPNLFTPYQIRDTVLPNRLVLAPMMQYRAKDGFALDWHLVHFGKFALGGFGTVMTEVVSVEPRGRITHGDLGIWSDEHIAPLKRCTDFIHSQGALAAIQIGHAGRKASTQRAWEGGGPLNEEDATRGEAGWDVVGPTNVAFAEGHPVPHALTESDIAVLLKQFGEAARRADQAGFDVIEIHGAHGYLISSFLSPVTNTRTDAYGGDLNGRMRFAIEVSNEMRKNWPAGKPLFFRISVEDGTGPGGWGVADTLMIAPLLREAGVDIIDCSSGGISGSATLQNTSRGPGYQVSYADAVKNLAHVPSMAVGLILSPQQAEDVLQSGKADLIAIGRQGLYDPFWPLHAMQSLRPDPDFNFWEAPSGWWLQRRAAALAKLDILPSGEPAANDKAA